MMTMLINWQELRKQAHLKFQLSTGECGVPGRLAKTLAKETPGFWLQKKKNSFRFLINSDKI